ncbi:CLUMA_CG012408, isoform A [Clunio marinus]|uniref:CLUMA_CG012408, isoform A n=1 Tax=Clunio marinus TaxID=568069 RepID=A0A1J1IJ56_9DIPT|nr:CLUMA_CG012408, isoform A [Clunio marinus]
MEVARVLCNSQHSTINVVTGQYSSMRLAGCHSIQCNKLKLMFEMNVNGVFRPVNQTFLLTSIYVLLISNLNERESKIFKGEESC